MSRSSVRRPWYRRSRSLFESIGDLAHLRSGGANRPRRTLLNVLSLEERVVPDAGPREDVFWGGCVHVDNSCANSPTLLQQDLALGAQPNNFSAAPIRYADGIIKMDIWDARSDAQGASFGLYRSWTNWLEFASGSYLGNGWTSGMPSLVTNGSYFGVVSSGTQVRFFDYVYSEYNPSHDTLSHDSGTGQFVVTDPLGDQVRFWDFDSARPALERGQFVSATDPAGNTIAVTSLNSDGTYAEVQRSTSTSAGTLTESVVYTYDTTNPDNPVVTAATLRRKIGSGSWTTVRQVAYEYYDGSEAHGNAGDLKRVTVKDAAGATIDTSYYRYYTPSDILNEEDETIGYVGGLKYELSPASYARLAASVSNPLTETDSQVAAFADHYYEYDDLQQVTKEVAQGTGCSACTGGFGTYTFSYGPGGGGGGDVLNNAVYMTTETLPDGNTNTVYTNAHAQLLETIFTDTSTSQQWYTLYRYDTVSGNLQGMLSPSGLVTRYEYTDGLVTQVSLQRGIFGDPVPQKAITYTSHTVNGISVHPVASETVYRNDDGTGAETTSYDYTWSSSSNRPLSMTVTLPTVGSSQNGPNSADVSATFYDAYGRATWQKDADGFIRYTEYDPATGAVTKTITDVDTSQTSDFTGLPTGWSTPTGGGLHLKWVFTVDSLGRVTKSTGPNGTVRYNVYNDPAHEVRSYDWDAAGNHPIGPVTLTRDDRGHEYIETLTFTAPSTYTWGTVPDGSETVGTVQSLSRSIVNDAGQTIHVDQYFDLTSVSYSQTSATLGSQWSPSTPTAGNYYRTDYAYDDRGRLKKTVTPMGTITRTLYDGLGRVTSSWVGTDDTPTSGYWSATNTAGTDLVKVTENEYDGGDVGDGNLTKQTQYPGGGADPRVTVSSYDWRNRLVATKGGAQTTESTSVNRPLFYFEYDNLNHVTNRERYDGDGVALPTDGDGDGVPDQPSGSLLRARSTAEYDNQGRVFRANTWSVNPSTGSVSTYNLHTDTWYDHRGNVVKVLAPGGLVTKTRFDGANRPVTVSKTDGGGDSGWSDALNVTGDTVLEQAETTYDGNGNVLLTTTRQRFDDATGTGALGTPTSGVHARVYFMGNYYDKANRLTDTVNVGTNGGSAWTRPTSVPSRSDTALVTSTIYDDAGRAYRAIDPRAIESRTYYDLMGRTIKTIDNYVDGTVSDADDKTTEFTYFGPSLRRTVTLRLTGSGYQTTQYVYGVSSSDGSAITSNDLLRETRYPDKTTGAASSGDAEHSSYNALGQPTTFIDRNGTTHAYGFDVVGRPTVDAVTTLGSGVDGTVRRLETAYDSVGLAFLSTSYSAASGGSVVNQVQRVFNGLGQLVTEYQSHAGAVNTSTTPAVHYSYSEMAGGANHSRPTGITYADGYGINYLYGDDGGLDDRISRVDGLEDGDHTLEAYDFLGLSTVVRRVRPGIDVDMTLANPLGDATGEAGDQYNGLDRFGRVVDLAWYNSVDDANSDDFVYGYDRDGNRQYRDNRVNSAFGELYSYDQLNQLTDFQRGTLNSTMTAITGTAAASQSWATDIAGNFTSVTTNGSAETRSTNRQNELTAVGSNSLGYDANGNLTQDISPTAVPTGWSEQAVNQTATGTQTTPVVASNAAGRSIVVWVGPDADGWGIFARWLNPDGTPDGAEFAVNTTTTGDQTTPAAAVSPDGTAFIAWQTPDGWNDGIAGRRFTSAGAVDSTQFAVSTTTYGPQWEPQVGYAADGSAVVIWGDPYNARIAGQRFGSSGTATGSEMVFSATQTDWHTSAWYISARLSVAADGSFAAGWLATDWTTHSDYVVRTFAADGTATSDEEIAHSGFGTEAWDISRGADGAILTAWTAGDWFGFGIYARARDAEGTWGDPSLVPEVQYGNQEFQSLAALPGGGWAVAWRDGAADGSGAGVFARRLASDGTTIGGQFAVNTTTSGDQEYVRLAPAPGGFAATWVGPDASGTGIFTRRFTIGTEYRYDAWNRLVGAAGANGGEADAFDALGRHVQEGGRDLYYSKDWQVLEEQVSGVTKTQYLWSPVYVDALVLRDRDADGVSSNGLEERVYVQQDANWNVTALVDTDAAVVERYVYDPYGQATKLSASWGTYSGADRGWVYLHQGLRYDGIEDVYDDRRRAYSARYMRFLQVDPIRFRAGDMDLYRYEGDDPTGRLDPSGLLVDGGVTEVAVGVPVAACVATAAVGVGVGYVVSHQLNEATGIWDKLADWLYPPPPPINDPPIQDRKGDKCMQRWLVDIGRCDSIASQMKQQGFDPKTIAQWLTACHARANGRFSRCNDKLPDTLPPYPALPGVD
jgi:RHS repeat-associated protein